MLATYLAAYPWLAAAIIVTEIVVGIAVGWVLVRRPRAAWALAAAALLAVLVATLYPTGRELEIGCVLEGDLRILAPEPLANVALFVPPALLLGIATRSPWLGALAGSVLSAAIEALQAISPGIGRSCAVDDWIANSAGAVLGAGLAALVLLIARRAAPSATEPVPR